MNVRIVFYSMYGHVYRMAQAVFDGASEVAGADVKLLQVAETLPDELVEKLGGAQTRAQFAHIPLATVEDLAEADALIIGTPTRFGNMCAQMRAFLDGTGGLWASGALAGKVGSVFVSTNTQHGGQETTIISVMQTLLHHGMVIVGVPYTHPGLMFIDGVSGGSPYGASTIAGPDGSRTPTENELGVARFQGRHVAEIALKLHG